MERKWRKSWSRLRAGVVWVIELPERVEGVKTLGKWVGALSVLSVPAWKTWAVLWGWLASSWVEALVFVGTVFVSALCGRSLWRDSRTRRLYSCPAPIGEMWISRNSAMTILRQSQLVSGDIHEHYSAWEAQEILIRFAGECLDAIRGDFPEGGEVNRDALLWWMAQQGLSEA
ncbi:MAG: hypothetical protein OXE96_07970 [Gemmatimonadetes bacterium]|nr:hypothetical protein [Gemmatimonadota bacterium]